MPISINGTGTITGISAGGLPDDCITTADIAGSAVTTAKVNNEAISFAKLLSTDWTASLGASGYQKLPSGLIIQWGSGTAASNTSISFPTTFPTSAYCVIASCSNYGASRIVNAGNISTSGFTASGFVTNTAGFSSGEAFYYIALGK
jgi:hypothetical protein